MALEASDFNDITSYAEPSYIIKQYLSSNQQNAPQPSKFLSMDRIEEMKLAADSGDTTPQIQFTSESIPLFSQPKQNVLGVSFVASQSKSTSMLLDNVDKNKRQETNLSTNKLQSNLSKAMNSNLKSKKAVDVAISSKDNIRRSQSDKNVTAASSSGGAVTSESNTKSNSKFKVENEAPTTLSAAPGIATSGKSFNPGE